MSAGLAIHSSTADSFDVNCPSEAVLAEYVAGRLDDKTRPGVEQHLQICEACSDIFAATFASVGTSRTGELRAGTRVGSYTVVGVIATGGMGAVYSARDPKGRLVALKLSLDLDASDSLTRRFGREARAMQQLEHPNVVALYDFGRDTSSIEPRSYIAMEYVEGNTLDLWLRQHKRRWREVLDVFIGAARGLAHAHAHGVVHRDFKPQNVLIDAKGQARVLDFGLARFAKSTSDLAPLTKTGEFLGTPLYMAPEQLDGSEVDARTDQWAFAAALYEGLYGRRPFAGGSLPELRDNVKAASLPTIDSDVPRAIHEALARALAVDPAARHASMDILIRHLQSAANSHAPGLPPAGGSK